MNGLPLDEEIDIAGDRLWSLHVHDNHGEADEHLIPGLGTIQWPPVLKALERINYAGPFMMEIMRENPIMQRLSPLETINQAYAAARRILRDE